MDDFQPQKSRVHSGGISPQPWNEADFRCQMLDESGANKPYCLSVAFGKSLYGASLLTFLKKNFIMKASSLQTQIHDLPVSLKLIYCECSERPFKAFNESTRSPHLADTIFDKILEGKIPASIVYEDNDVLAFKDISPQAHTHVLVIPKKKAISLKDLKNWDSRDVGVFFQKVAMVAETIGISESGYRTVLNTGANGGQSVDYLHAHILGGEPLSGRFA
jgi:histidine triad (HIT) family protein